MPLSSILRGCELHLPQLEVDCASGVRGTSQASYLLSVVPSPPVQTERGTPALQGLCSLAVKALFSNLGGIRPAIVGPCTLPPPPRFQSAGGTHSQRTLLAQEPLRDH